MKMMLRSVDPNQRMVDSDVDMNIMTIKCLFQNIIEV